MKKMNLGRITVAVCMSVSLGRVATLHASDIEIYQGASAGKTTIFMMLDTSGSMGGDRPIIEDYPDRVTRANDSTCNFPGTDQGKVTYDGKDYYWTRSQCRYGYSGTTHYYDRITRLKDALMQIFSDQSIADQVNIGIGHFSTLKTEATGVLSSGRIIVPVAPLTREQRHKLLDAVWQLQANGQTPTAAAYAEAGAYMMGTTTKGNSSSGFDFSVSSAKTPDLSRYISPLPVQVTASTASCSGTGIYFLTDGYPNAVNKAAAQSIMQQSLSGTTTNPSFGCDGGLSDSEEGVWSCISRYATLLNNPALNPARMQIKTAVVGFGSAFEKAVNDNGEIRCEEIYGNPDVKNSCYWGNDSRYGQGGFYYANSPADISNSIKNFVRILDKPIGSVTTGSPTLPQDALNPLRIQPYGYYASFEPKPTAATQLWVGNLNKYKVSRGELQGSNDIPLITASGTLDASATGLWGTGGVQKNLPFGLDNARTTTQRVVWTNRRVNSATASQAPILQQVTIASLLGNGGAYSTDPYRLNWLRLLGYPVTSTASLTLDSLPAPVASQLGAVMHSTPILLTQRGKISVDAAGELDTTNRQDYLLYGTTQGLLHVVDVSTGIEKLAFVPHEMMANQPAAMLGTDGATGGSSQLFYGIDAPWTAFTQYVPTSDGGLSVSQGSAVDNSTLTGKQWVYGGLRMGGKSYYALDLTQMDRPQLKFHIDPLNRQIMNAAGTTSSPALEYMGQSWSKPTVAYVNFGGVRKLVMFVGGGYDTGYESPAYDQTSQIGAGVYMFDANSGQLLWWASANATSAQGAQAATASPDLKYSVVSQINAIDRNGDGLVDHLYFGDLGGQVFRIDLNNTASTPVAGFATRIAKLYSDHPAGGYHPRFYEMPSFSVYDNGVDGKFGVVALTSGNRSSPLAGDIGANNLVQSPSAVDAVYALYDHDVTRADLYVADISMRNVATSLQLLTDNMIQTGEGIPQKMPTGYVTGWKYVFSDKKGEYKGMNGIMAVDKILYANVFHRDGLGIAGSCGAGVKGESYTYQFCLPYGSCGANFFGTGAQGAPRVKIGAGLLGSGLSNVTPASGSRVNVSQMGLLAPRAASSGIDCRQSTSKMPQCMTFTTTPRLNPLRWYEVQ